MFSTEREIAPAPKIENSGYSSLPKQVRKYDLAKDLCVLLFDQSIETTHLRLKDISYMGIN
jgi:hypothetical protein